MRVKSMKLIKIEIESRLYYIVKIAYNRIKLYLHGLSMQRWIIVLVPAKFVAYIIYIIQAYPQKMRL